MHTLVTIEDGDRPEFRRDGMDLVAEWRDVTLRFPVAVIPWAAAEIARLTADRRDGSPHTLTR